MKRGPHALVLGALLVATIGGTAQATPGSKCIAAAEAGQQLRSEGKLVAARKKLAICTALECPVVVRRDCARWVEELDSTTPSITVRLEDGAGNEVPEGTVLIDGEKLGPMADGRAIPVDPGTHKLVWEHDGSKTEREVVVREGERSRVIVLKAPASKAASRDPRVSAVPPASRDATSSSPSTVPWILGGVGVAASGIGIGLWLTGLGEHSDLGRTCAAAHTCTDDQISSARTKLIVGDILVGAGVILIAGALYFLLKTDPPPSAAAAR